MCTESARDMSGGREADICIYSGKFEKKRGVKSWYAYYYRILGISWQYNTMK